MKSMLTRRSALFLLAAPAVVRAASLMPVRALAWVPSKVVLYVDPNWPGSQLGTRDNPWKTIQRALDYFNSSDFLVRGEQVTINLASGEYR